MDREHRKLYLTLRKGEKIKKALEEKINKVCPNCGSQLTYRLKHRNEFILICVNTECPFPFDQMSIQSVTVKFTKDESDRQTDTVSEEVNVRQDTRIEAQMKSDIQKVKQELLKLKEIHEKADTRNGDNAANEIFNEIENLIEKMNSGLELKDRLQITEKMCENMMPNSFPKVCPVCRSQLSFKISGINSVSLMCAGAECTFPIGYVDTSLLHIKVNKIIEYEPINIENSKQELLLLEEQADYLLDKPDEESEKQEMLQKNLQEMKKLREKFDNICKEKYNTHTINTKQPFIKNETWIRNLVMLQSHSRMKMVTPEEVNLLKKPVSPNISVVRGDDNGGIPTFTIDFVNK